MSSGQSQAQTEEGELEFSLNERNPRQHERRI